MLTEQELDAALQRLVDSWRKSYPIPWPVTLFIDRFQLEPQTLEEGGISPWGAFIVSLLPSPEWKAWVISTLMHKAWNKWGETLCRELLEHNNWEKRYLEKDADRNWMIEGMEREIALMVQHWFPGWVPPANLPASFPSYGVKSTAAREKKAAVVVPAKEIFR